MSLAPEDREQVRNFGLLTALAVGTLILAPLPDMGIGIKELWKRIGALEKQVANTKEDFEQKGLRIKRIPNLVDELKDREPEIAKYEARLPKSRKVPDLFRDIDRFQQASGVDIIVQTRIEPNNRGDYIELPVRVEARGDYDSLAVFINQLERNQRFAQVKDLQITEKPGEEIDDSDDPNFAVHDAVMTISTFMFQDQIAEEESDGKG